MIVYLLWSDKSLVGVYSEWETMSRWLCSDSAGSTHSDTQVRLGDTGIDLYYMDCYLHARQR